VGPPFRLSAETARTSERTQATKVPSAPAHVQSAWESAGKSYCTIFAVTIGVLTIFADLRALAGLSALADWSALAGLRALADLSALAGESLLAVVARLAVASFESRAATLRVDFEVD
jgi:hypothetical protein